MCAISFHLIFFSFFCLEMASMRTCSQELRRGCLACNFPDLSSGICWRQVLHVVFCTYQGPSLLQSSKILENGFEIYQPSPYFTTTLKEEFQTNSKELKELVLWYCTSYEFALDFINAFYRLVVHRIYQILTQWQVDEKEET